jgi:hypothetical protein
VNFCRSAMVAIFILLAVCILWKDAAAQTVIDTLGLDPLPPDSTYVRMEGRQLIIGWYPAHDSLSAVIGSKFLTNWYSNDPEIAIVDVFGTYLSNVDRTLRVERNITTQTIPRDTVGYEISIPMVAEVVDRNDSYRQLFNIGSSAYSPGDTITLTLTGVSTSDILDADIHLVFHEGAIDTNLEGGPAYFEVDLQTYEGFHIWRGLSPYPSEMTVLEDLSREDAFRGVDYDSVYFDEWPRIDDEGRPYYEWVDNNIFVGFTYYYHVSSYDRGYFKGQFLYNKIDNFICHEVCTEDTLQHPDLPHCDIAVHCDDVAKVVTISTATGTDVEAIYAVPNPFRTGTSAETSPFYDNFPDNSIKFYNMPKEANLKIYTVAGDLVWETHHSNPDGTDGVVTWDTKNKHGQLTGSGVYIYRVESDAGDSMYGRIVIIR